MRPIRLYNSRTKQVETLAPVSGTHTVTMYNCGPTVYKRQHIGNMRRFLHSDFLKRTLELFGYEVKDVTNITDVGHLPQDDIDAGEDKMEKAARESMRTVQDIANEQIDLFKQDIRSLNIQESSLYPRASEHVQDMIALIQILLEKGHAYVTESGVYYDVASFPKYGELSGNTVAALNAGHRVEVRSEKKNPADFALWMLDDTHLQLWDSPWGKGYPGWHIECSAMGMKCLGETIDIHTGGEDNRFPHHENEIAQSEGATGKPFARIWMHNRHLLLSGKKMAKREGEAITMDTLAEKGYSPLAFRLLVFAHHYRSPIDFSWELLDEYQKHLDSTRHLLERLRHMQEIPPASPSAHAEEFKTALADDLNTPKAFAIFLQTIKEINKALDTDKRDVLPALAASLMEMDSVIGVLTILQKDIHDIPLVIIRLAEEREQAKQAKDYEKADMIREEIVQKGFFLQDTPHGFRITKKQP